MVHMLVYLALVSYYKGKNYWSLRSVGVSKFSRHMVEMERHDTYLLSHNLGCVLIG